MAEVKSNNFLDTEGLKHLWEKIKSHFVKKGEVDLFTVVAELPTDPSSHLIYLVPGGESESENIYAEYIYTGVTPVSADNPYDESKWEKFGEFKSDVKLETSSVTVSNTIPVAGGPLADELNKAGITSIEKDITVQELLQKLFTKELWPSPVFTEGAISVSLSLYDASGTPSTGLVEVGAKLATPAFRMKAPVYTVTDRKWTGLTYGSSLSNNNTKESSATSVTASHSTGSPVSSTCGIQVSFNGAVLGQAKGTNYSSLTTEQYIVTFNEGENTILAEGAVDRYSVQFSSFSEIYACSNLGNTSEDHKLESKAATTVKSEIPVGTCAVKRTGVHPFFAATSAIGTLTKQPLQTSSEYTFTMVAETDTDKHKFAVISGKSVTSMKMLNTLSGKYEDYSISNFTTSEQNLSCGAGTKTYTVYTRNDGKNGSATFKITIG